MHELLGHQSTLAHLPSHLNHLNRRCHRLLSYHNRRCQCSAVSLRFSLQTQLRKISFLRYRIVLLIFQHLETKKTKQIHRLHWKLDKHETSMRQRLRLRRNYDFHDHKSSTVAARKVNIYIYFS